VRDPVASIGFVAERRLARRAWLLGVCLVSLFHLFPGMGNAELPGLPQARRDAAMQQCRQIGLSLFSYANDNGGSYPAGKSSTEIFQKLIDGNYITDPSIFYLPLPGKTKPAGGKLKPENVCFDVTSGIDSDTPDALPLVFVTGYKVAYAPDAAAAPLVKPYPLAMIVCYKSMSAKVLIPGADGSVANFIPSSFNPTGKTYVQLTP
jgi:hypothetical protein